MTESNLMQGPRPLLAGKAKLIIGGLILVALAEMIGRVGFKLGPGQVTLLPMLWALLMAALWGGLHRRLPGALAVSPQVQAWASAALGVGVMLFLSRMGLTVGQSLPTVIASGPALIFQELGHFLGTIVIGLPLALVLGMKREAVGATFSIGREGSLMIIGERYGLNSAEGRGVLGEYITGTVLGAIFLASFAGFLASLGVFDPRSLAMGAGVGSASLMAASLGAVMAQTDPAQHETLTALAATANMLTGIVGFYFTMLVSLPLCSWLYHRLEPVLGRLTRRGRAPQDTEAGMEAIAAPPFGWGDRLLAWGFVVLGAALANHLGYGADLLQSLAGCLLLMVPVVIAAALRQRFARFPEMIALSLMTAVVAVPGLLPAFAPLVALAAKMNFLAFTTPVLALAGFSVARDLPVFRRLGWRIVAVSLAAEAATFLGAVLVAELFH
ncbi:DUF3100 domain-containing protein [Pseudooceanicola sp. GBMRC 2024]|uniref:DUF3100 domain-containing protein n=2 Tax=Paracoccaceae TaxID=31989 RepID=A0A6L7GA75_9RHOB|nr:DUF3100 domain-containing protein [Pseudooceanicola albus]